MRICIDSCVFIRGIHTNAEDFYKLIDFIGKNDCLLLIPRLIVLEVTRNLQTPLQVKRFHQPFTRHLHAQIIDEPTPAELVNKYVDLGLREKGDAYIGAFAEWMQIDFLISDNRHFVRELNTDAFEICDPITFLASKTA